MIIKPQWQGQVTLIFADSHVSLVWLILFILAVKLWYLCLHIFVTYFLADRWSAWALCEKTFASSGHHHAIILHLLQNFQIRFFTVFPIANWVILLLSVGVHCTSCSLVYGEHCWFFWYPIPVLLLFIWST